MRIRITFQKTEAMRFTGHLDLFKTWERTIRRAKLPLAYSRGFHPQPRLNLACALPLGFTSDHEIADLWLEKECSLEEISLALNSTLPPGIRILSIQSIPLHEPALQTQVRSAEYEITILAPVEDLEKRIEALLTATELPRSRRGKPYDLRPLIELLERLPDDEEGFPRLRARLSAQEGATGRPEEVVAALGIEPTHARYHRTALFLVQSEGLC